MARRERESGAEAQVSPSLLAGCVAGAGLLGMGLLWRNARSLLRKAKEGEQKYRSMMEGSTNGILLLSNVVEECNRQACILWGRNREEMLGRTLAEIAPPFEPDNGEWGDALGGYVAKALAGVPQFFAWRHLRNGRELLDLDLSLKAIRVGGRKALLLVARDVTEQRRVEEDLRLRNDFIENVTDNMPIGLSVLTYDDLTVRYMNRKAEEIVGWPREIINDHEQFWQAAIPDPDYRAEVVGRLDRDLAGGNPSQMAWEVRLTRRSGETAVNIWASIPMLERNLVIVTVQDYTEQRRAEEALRQSEMDRVQLQTELNWAAQVQRSLLPVAPPTLPGFEIAAFCQPAHQVGGDFYDWQETAPGTVTVAFGDIMGKGMAAALLMATVRAALRAVTRGHTASDAVTLAEQALRHDLEGTERFVTLFLAQIDGTTGRMSYVDCGHGYAVLLRRDGKVEELLPRGLPLGISADEAYQEGNRVIEEGDALIVYSDGLLEALMVPELDHGLLSQRLAGAEDAATMVDLIAGMAQPGASFPDDLTILVLRRR